MRIKMDGLKEIALKNHSLSSQKKLDFKLSYQVFGQPLHQAPIVLVNHALTGNSEVAGKNGWWKTLVGKSQVINLNRYTVIAFDIPGNGYKTTDSSLNQDYKLLSTQAIAKLFWKGLEELQVSKLYAAIGSSLGGAISWEMAFLKPDSIEHLIPIATNLKASDWLIGNVLVQDNILNNSKNPIEDARMHAMHLYRNPEGFKEKFNNQFKKEENQYAIESWLKYHGRTLNQRFSLEAYKLMNHLLKTIGENLTKEDIINFAKNSTVKIHSIAVDTDYLFTEAEQKYTYNLIKNHNKNISFQVIKSIHGHDAFLIEYEQLNKLLKNIF